MANGSDVPCRAWRRSVRSICVKTPSVCRSRPACSGIAVTPGGVASHGASQASLRSRISTQAAPSRSRRGRSPTGPSRRVAGHPGALSRDHLRRAPGPPRGRAPGPVPATPSRTPPVEPGQVDDDACGPRCRRRPRLSTDVGTRSRSAARSVSTRPGAVPFEHLAGGLRGDVPRAEPGAAGGHDQVDAVGDRGSRSAPTMRVGLVGHEHRRRRRRTRGRPAGRRAAARRGPGRCRRTARSETRRPAPRAGGSRPGSATGTGVGRGAGRAAAGAGSSSRRQSPVLPPVFSTTRTSVSTAAGSTAFTMSCSARPATATAVSASISTPVRSAVLVDRGDLDRVVGDRRGRPSRRPARSGGRAG